MIDGISITCFAASYALAFAMELLRLRWKTRPPRSLVLGVVGAGLVAQFLYLLHRATAADTARLVSQFDWYLVASWALAATYLYLAVYHPRDALGLFLLPLVLGLVAVARWFADPTPFPASEASNTWGWFHGTTLLLGTVTVSVGFVAGLMYLIQSARLKRKAPPGRLLRLPSLEWLEKANARAIVISVIMFSLGFLSGVKLNLVKQRMDQPALPLSDPTVWSLAALLGWLVAAALFSLLYKPARQGRKVAYLTVATFVVLAFSLSVQFWLTTQHGRTTQAGEVPREQNHGAAVAVHRNVAALDCVPRGTDARGGDGA